jgi:hypothetical protein
VNYLRKWWTWPIIAVLAIAILFTLLPGPGSEVDATAREFIADARGGRVESIEVDGHTIKYKTRDSDSKFEFETREGETVRSLLTEAGLSPDEFPPISTGGGSWWWDLPFFVMAFLPAILVVVLLVAAIRWLWRKGSATTA